MFTRSLLAIVALSLSLSSYSFSAYRNGSDLISLHYDHAPDRDDGHATVSALMVTSFHNINPHVVSGAYGENNKHQYDDGAEAVMQATWQNQWIDAHQNWSEAVSTTTDTWLTTLNNGGDIYVAEGGQSDFTADVVRNIRTISTIDTNTRVTIIQHSTWNENQANRADLNYVRQHTQYVKIADGNRNNQTANLNQPSESFVSIARSSRYASAWNAAFNYLNPNNKLDFSDTVELLHILGISKDVVANADDFARVFFAENPQTPPLNGNNQDPIPNCSTTVPDYDHDNYGWENNQSCLIAEVLPEVAPDNPPVVTPDLPPCTDEISDPDSDGHALENGQVCAINQGPEVTRPITPQIAYFPNCSGTSTDFDNDGYGWENEQTCVVVDIQTPHEPTPLEQITPFPVCSATVSDDDRDGYGWENNLTCTVERPNSNSSPVIVVFFPDCATPTTDSDGDGYGWENGHTCVIQNTETANSAVINLPTCGPSVVDEDGDGYGWENGHTCNTQITTPIQSDEDIVVVSLPYCSDNYVDADADGYGWEHHSSCIVTLASYQSTIAIAGIAYPVCGAELNDADGDGFGWQNQHSCIFPDTFPNQAALQQLPDCSENVVDYDGDGYGWEQEKSCIFR